MPKKKANLSYQEYKAAQLAGLQEKWKRKADYENAVEEKYTSLGINYRTVVCGHDFIKDPWYYTDTCPDYLKRIVDDVLSARRHRREVLQWFWNLQTERGGADLPPEQRSYNNFFATPEEDQKRVDADHRYNKAMLIMRHEIENMVREENGIPKIGERWVNETLLYQIVKDLFPTEKVVHHARPDFLQGLEYDVYIPSLKIAFEYDGEQHFQPMEHWGGDEAFERLVERDEKKNRLSEENGVQLHRISYEEPVSVAFVQYLLNKGKDDSANAR